VAEAEPRAAGPARARLPAQGETFAEPAAGFGVGRTTAWRYAEEVTALLAARAPKLRQAVRDAKKAGHAYVILASAEKGKALLASFVDSFASVRVADWIESRIRSGELKPGSRLPPERELARDCGVAYDTVRRAAMLLRERGLIITVPGGARTWHSLRRGCFARLISRRSGP